MTALAAVGALALPAQREREPHLCDRSGAQPATDRSQFDGAAGLDTDSFDNLYVADYANHRIQKFSPDGEWLGAFGSSGSGDGQLNHPIDVAVDGNGDVWVADRATTASRSSTAGGSFLDKQGGFGTADGQFDTPSAIATDSANNVYVADYGNHRVQKLDSDGNHLLTWGSPGTGDRPVQLPIGRRGQRQHGVRDRLRQRPRAVLHDRRERRLPSSAAEAWMDPAPWTSPPTGPCSWSTARTTA